MQTPSDNDPSSPDEASARTGGDGQVLVDISDIIVSEESVSALQGEQLWMRPERDVGH